MVIFGDLGGFDSLKIGELPPKKWCWGMWQPNHGGIGEFMGVYWLKHWSVGILTNWKSGFNQSYQDEWTIGSEQKRGCCGIAGQRLRIWSFLSMWTYVFKDVNQTKMEGFSQPKISKHENINNTWSNPKYGFDHILTWFNHVSHQTKYIVSPKSSQHVWLHIWWIDLPFVI